jgi:hypothetical protein
VFSRRDLVLALLLVACAGRNLRGPETDTVAGGIDQTRSTLVVSADSPLLANLDATARIVVTLIGSDGRPMKAVPVEILVSGDSNELKGPTISKTQGWLSEPLATATDAHGMLKAELITTRAGTKTLVAVARLATGLVPLSHVATVKFEPGVAVRLSLTAMAGVIAGTHMRVWANIEDRLDNVVDVDGKAVMLTIPAVGDDDAPDVKVVANTVHGVASFDIAAPTVTGVITLVADTEGLAGTSSNPIGVLPADPSPKHSSIQLTEMPNPTGANGTNPRSLQIDVTVKDSYGNPWTKCPIALSATGVSNVLTPASGVADASGHFQATWSSTKAEPKQLTVTARGVMLGTVDVKFPGPAAP